MFDKKLQAVKERSSMNIKSGRVMMQAKDRDWLFALIETLTEENKKLKKEI